MSMEKTVSDSDTRAKKRGSADKRKPTLKEPVMYLGPDIKGIAKHRSVYCESEVDSFFADKIKEIPVLGALLVPISESGKKMAELEKKEGIYRIYQAAVQKLAGKEDGDEQ